jgi:hypothetical protein
MWGVISEESGACVSFSPTPNLLDMIEIDPLAENA